MLSKARDALQKCEECLRGLVAAAAAAGQYDAVETITGWARTLGRMRGGCEDESIPEGANEVEQSVASGVAGRTLNRPSSSKGRPAYPRFARSRTELVKIGWSKKEKKEYLHRAPWAVVELLCQRLKTWGSKEFTSEEILPLLGGDGVEVPSYQSYLCLAWLRDSGLITKEGRQGYFVPRGHDLIVESANAWKNLPSKR